MFKSIRARITAATAGCLAIALLINTVINYQVTRQDNQQAQRDTLSSTSISHSGAIADWVNSKMTMIASLQSAALTADPVPNFAQIAQAGGFINVYAGYASKTAKFSDANGIPADYDPTIRPWYQQAVKADAPIVTAPYVDAASGKLVVTFAVPVKENGTLSAVVAGDVAMDSVVANVRTIQPTPQSSGLLINSDGTVIAAMLHRRAGVPQLHHHHRQLIAEDVEGMGNLRHLIMTALRQALGEIVCAVADSKHRIADHDQALQHRFHQPEHHRYAN